MWCNGLRILHCHCSVFHHCYGAGSVPGSGTSICCGCGQNNEWNKNYYLKEFWTYRRAESITNSIHIYVCVYIYIYIYIYIFCIPTPHLNLLHTLLLYILLFLFSSSTSSLPSSHWGFLITNCSGLLFSLIYRSVTDILLYHHNTMIGFMILTCLGID